MAPSRAISLLRPDAIALALALGTASAEAAPRDDILRAREMAGRCDYRAALALDAQAIDALAAGGAADLLLTARQDAATNANALLDFRAAETQARAALAAAEAKWGKGSANWALVAQNLAVALAGQRRTAEARALFDQILAALAAGPGPAALLNARIAAASFAFDGGRPAEGLALVEAMAAVARDPALPAPLRIKALVRMADGYRRSLKLREADAAADEAERLLAGAADPRLSLTRAAIAAERGRLVRALAIVDTLERNRAAAADPCDPMLTADIAHRRGTIHMLRREVPEAAAAFGRALGEIVRLKRGGDPREGETIYGLAVAAAMGRDFDRASALFDRAVEAFGTAYGGASEAEAQTLIEKALMLSDAGRPRDGLAAARRALAILAGPVEQGPLARGYAHAAIGLSARQAGELNLADAELRLALATFEKARGSSFDLTPGLTALGEIALAQRRLNEADSLFRRTLAIQSRVGGGSAIALGTSYSRLATVEEARGARIEALADSAKAVNVLRRRLAIGEARPWNDAEIERRAARSILTLDMRLTAAAQAPERLDSSPDRVKRLFEDIQLASATSTGAAIAQMAVRLEQRDAALSGALRERTELAAEWRNIQDELVGGLAERRKEMDDDARMGLVGRQQAIETRLAEIDTMVARSDPGFDLLLKSRTVGIGEVQSVLGPKEALVALSLTDGETYVSVTTRSRAATFRTGLSVARARDLVERIRRTVDPARWKGELPPVDTEAAAELYTRLIAPAEELLKEADTLFFVPDGPLASLPIGLLLTRPTPPVVGEPEDYTALPWLVKRFAVADYPSAASLVALRRMEARRPSGPAMLGVGDPVFNGKAGDQRGAVLRAISTTRLADPAMLRQLAALPDTRTELMSIASSLSAPGTRLLLGSDAREASVRTMPLKDFGLVVFATHGLIAGEIVGYAEPALALTPPAKASEADDGLLAASEIATLDLNADWVILSACNTAAGDGSARAEPLSGLAKSFFYAGARSLLVTHWAVDTEAAAMITSNTVRKSMTGLSHAAALRGVALDFIEDKDKSLRTHPFFWAPFTLIGG